MLSAIFWYLAGAATVGAFVYFKKDKTVDFINSAANTVSAQIDRVTVNANGTSTIISTTDTPVVATSNTVVVSTPSP